MATFDEMKGRPVYDARHDKIGALDDFYVDDHTNQPTWITVKTGMFGNKVSFVPLAKAAQVDDGLQIAFTKEQVSEAPRIDSGGQINEDDEAELYSYYSSALGKDLEQAQQGASGQAPTSQQPDGNQADQSGTNAVQPEQRMAQPSPAASSPAPSAVGGAVQPIETGRVRLQKFVVTENVTFTVPIQREEVRIVRDEAGADNQPTGSQTPAPASITPPNNRTAQPSTPAPGDRVLSDR